MRKSTTGWLTLVLISCPFILLAQTSYGLQNHPAPRQLKERMTFHLEWSDQMQWITLILLVGAALTWGVYLYTVARMYAKKSGGDLASRSMLPEPSSMDFSISRNTIQHLRGERPNWSISMVSRTPSAQDSAARPLAPGTHEQASTQNTRSVPGQGPIPDDHQNR